MKSVSLMPSNLYGPGDNFHPDNGHVIPAMITKFQNSGGKSVMFWGDGTPKREFLYSEDLADACLFAMDHFENAELINVGSGENVSIKELSNTVASVVKYDGEIKWDTSRPNGTPNRPLDCSKMTKLGWKPKHTLSQGLQKTYDWFYRKHRFTNKVVCIELENIVGLHQSVVVNWHSTYGQTLWLIVIIFSIKDPYDRIVSLYAGHFVDINGVMWCNRGLPSTAIMTPLRRGKEIANRDPRNLFNFTKESVIDYSFERFVFEID